MSFITGFSDSGTQYVQISIRGVSRPVWSVPHCRDSCSQSLWPGCSHHPILTSPSVRKNTGSGDGCSVIGQTGCFWMKSAEKQLQKGGISVIPSQASGQKLFILNHTCAYIPHQFKLEVYLYHSKNLPPAFCWILRNVHPMLCDICTWAAANFTHSCLQLDKPGEAEHLKIGWSFSRHSLDYHLKWVQLTCHILVWSTRDVG